MKLSILSSLSSTISASFMASCALLTGTFIGCGGDSVSSNGEMGNLSYSLYFTYEMQPETIDQIKIVTGHEQNMSYSEVDPEEEDEETDDVEATPIVYSNQLLTLDGKAVTEPCECGKFMASNPGEYYFTTHKDGHLYDRIKLSFEKPTALETLSWVREPFGNGEFVAQGSPESFALMEGSQLALLNIPIGPLGDRLVGNVSMDIDVEPVTAAIWGASVYAVYEEEGVYASTTTFSLIFIEPGPAVIHITDVANGVTHDLVVDVSPIEAPDEEAPVAEASAE